MSYLTSIASSAIYSRFAQCRTIQEMAAGFGTFHIGKDLFWKPNPNPEASTLRKIGRKLAGAALIAGGVMGMVAGANRLLSADPSHLKETFVFGHNPGPRLVEDPYEAAFRKNAPVNHYPTTPLHVLFLGAGQDADDGALSPQREALKAVINIPSVIFDLARMTQFTYKIIRHPLQICEEIAAASQNHSVNHLVFGMHGNPKGMAVAPLTSFSVFDRLPPNCFDGLAPDARILLESCSTGATTSWRPNFAEWISWISGKEVIAPGSDMMNGKCYIDAHTGRLSMQTDGVIVKDGYRTLGDVTKYFHVTGSLSEQAGFFTKMLLPTALGAMATWQTMRLGASVLQGTGAAAGWLVDKSAFPVKRIAEASGLYTPGRAQILYAVVKGSSQLLNVSGRAIHKGMDFLIDPVSQLGSWILGKGMSVVKSLSKVS